MVRKIIHIDEEKCNGCGLCANACHEAAIEMVDGKAKLIRDDYCDGLGNCLPACPTGAISFIEREAAAYDEEAVKEHVAQRKEAEQISKLCNWPVQIKLAPLSATYFQGADLLIAADCTAYAYATFHQDFVRGKVTLIGCTKLDNEDYSEKLKEIIARNEVKSITVLRMEVPCCGGMEYAVAKALEQSGKKLPMEVTVIGIDGDILSKERR